jgi:hypothetical protein
MLNKLIVGILGLVVVVAGIAAFSAFTAQLINLEAHVEKEIELAAVKNCVTDPNTRDIICEEDDGNFGVVIPQELYDKKIELTLSKSFFDQDRFFDVTFDLLWECKQIEPAQDKAPADGFDDCRPVENPANHDPSHPNGELDGSLRDYVQNIVTTPNCIAAQQGPNPSKLPQQKDVELIGSGEIDKNNKKCFFDIKLLAPPCADSFNAATDPLGPNVKTVNCHFDKNGSLDPQEWEHFADIGDEFKIQVTGHSLPCGVIDRCIDFDGIASSGRGLAAQEVTLGDTLTSWPTSGGNVGIDWFDNDVSLTWTFGDDLHSEDTSTCPTALRDGKHDLGKDCKILDLNGDLANGQGVECDLEVGLANPNGHSTDGTAASCPDPALMFYDANNSGRYDNGEDIVLDVNGNNIFD